MKLGFVFAIICYILTGVAMVYFGISLWYLLGIFVIDMGLCFWRYNIKKKDAIVHGYYSSCSEEDDDE